jgi:hypothetical protein
MFKFDFKEDWKAYVEVELKALGFSYDEDTSTSKNFLKLLNAQRRIPNPQPRKIFFAKTFNCPKHLERDFNVLLEKITNGDKIRPYLSKNIKKNGYIDYALDDFGVLHFHFKPARTGELAFAWITQGEVFFVDVQNHGKAYPNVWFNTNFVQIIHDNWPELIARYKLPFESDKIDSNARKNFRKNGVNSHITVSDGSSYMSPGGGFVSGGYTIVDGAKNMFIVRHLENYETLIKQEETQFRGFLKLNNDGYLTLKMGFHIHTGAFWVFEPNSETCFIKGQIGDLLQPKLQSIC